MGLSPKQLHELFEKLKKEGVPSKKEREKAVARFKKRCGKQAWERFLEATDVSKINKDMERLVAEDMAKMEAERKRREFPDYLL